jgi:hypothetical protein
MLNVKKSSSYSYGKPSFGSGYGVSYSGSAGGLGNWALQQLLSQQLSQGTESGVQGKLGGAKRGPTLAASGSGQHEAGYAARMVAGRSSLPMPRLRGARALEEGRRVQSGGRGSLHEKEDG